MNYQENVSYITPKTKEFIDDILLHSVHFKMDRMDDHSWRRIISDQPLSWVFNNTDKITIHTLMIINHTYEAMKESWGSSRHIELNIELRAETSTYILSAEIDFKYLSYFVDKYSLKKNQIPNV